MLCHCWLDRLILKIVPDEWNVKPYYTIPHTSPIVTAFMLNYISVLKSCVIVNCMPCSSSIYLQLCCWTVVVCFVDVGITSCVQQGLTDERSICTSSCICQLRLLHLSWRRHVARGRQELLHLLQRSTPCWLAHQQMEIPVGHCDDDMNSNY